MPCNGQGMSVGQEYNVPGAGKWTVHEVYKKHACTNDHDHDLQAGSSNDYKQWHCSTCGKDCFKITALSVDRS